jgi:1-phosphatidylinositol-4-phosphate 5-kinase
MEVRRAILMAQRQYQNTGGLPSAATPDPAGQSPTADRKASTSAGRSEKGVSRPGTSKERGPGRDRNSSRPSPLHTLESSNLPDEDPLPSDRSGFIFYSDDGGYRATDDQGGDWHGGLGGKMIVDGKIISDTEKEEKGGMSDDGDGVIYYLGVIDILTRWTCTKRLEHIWKGLKADRVSISSQAYLFVLYTNTFSILQHKISPVNPVEYGDRFFSFLQAVMRGGGGGESFA